MQAQAADANTITFACRGTLTEALEQTLAGRDDLHGHGDDEDDFLIWRQWTILLWTKMNF